MFDYDDYQSRSELEIPGILPACLLDEQDVRNLTKDPDSYGPDLFLAGHGNVKITRIDNLGREQLEDRPPASLLSGKASKEWPPANLWKALEERPTAGSAANNFTYFQSNYLWLTTVEQRAKCPDESTYCVYSNTSSACLGTLPSSNCLISIT